MIALLRRPPLRFLLLAIFAWTLLRAAWLAPWPAGQVVLAGWRFMLDSPSAAPAVPAPAPAPAAPPAPAPPYRFVALPTRPAPAPPPGARGPMADDGAAARMRSALLLATANGVPHWRRAAGPLPPPEPAARARLRLDSYLHARSGSGRAALAPGGQLGGSQAFVRATLPLGNGFAAAARLATPLHDRHGAEAALGLDWAPDPALPLRISAERRIALGSSGRDAWSLYAAGGAWRRLGPVEVDGYAQAGVVGARRRDLFADGAVRAGHRLSVTPRHAVTLGAGAWGAAQPGVARLDLGPRAAIALPLGPATGSLALEGRLRVAGGAAPGSGVALTLAAGF